jgi:phosphoglycolate phosphatase
MLANILFDLDGTLTDPKEGITRSIQFSLEKLGVTVPAADQLTWCIGPPLRKSFSRLLDTADDNLLDLALENFREYFSERGLFENNLYPQTVLSLTRVRKAGMKVYLATSKPRVFATRIIEHFNLSKFFDTIYGSELNGELSDKGELVAHILECENLDPSETLIVGDRKYDIRGGKENGIMTGAVSYGYGNLKEIAASDPDFVFESPSSLALFIESERGLVSP